MKQGSQGSYSRLDSYIIPLHKNSLFLELGWIYEFGILIHCNISSVVSYLCQLKLANHNLCIK